MPMYTVTLTADRQMSTTVEVYAEDEQQAERLAVKNAPTEAPEWTPYSFCVHGVVAEEVELCDSQDCDEGMHSWVDDPTFVSGNCAHCGEPYGI